MVFFFFEMIAFLNLYSIDSLNYPWLDEIFQDFS